MSATTTFFYSVLGISRQNICTAMQAVQHYWIKGVELEIFEPCPHCQMPIRPIKKDILIITFYFLMLDFHFSGWNVSWWKIVDIIWLKWVVYPFNKNFSPALCSMWWAPLFEIPFFSYYEEIHQWWQKWQLFSLSQQFIKLAFH